MTTPTCIPLNELGRLFYCLELLGYPVVQRTHFEFQGALPDIELLRQSYLLEVERYTIFKSVIRESYSGLTWNLCWEPMASVDAGQIIQQYDFSQGTVAQADERFSAIQFQAFTGFDSCCTPPFFAALCSYPGGIFKLITFFHHAAADSGGCLLFLRAWFERYNSLMGKPQGQPAEIIPVLTSKLISGTVSGFAKALACAAIQMWRIPGKPAKLLYGRSDFAGGINTVFRTIEPGRMKQHLAAAKQYGSTFTSLFAAAQTLALDEWKRKHHEPCETVSIDIHKGLRTVEPEFCEVQNRFSVFPVASRPQDRRDPAGLVQLLHRQSRHATDDRIAEKCIEALFPLRLRAARALLRVWGNLAFKNSRFGVSFQISNVGRIWTGADGRPLLDRLGDAEITACYVPGHPMPSIGTFTSFCTYRDRLFLTFNYSNKTLDRTTAEDFVRLIEQKLDELTATAAGRRT